MNIGDFAVFKTDYIHFKKGQPVRITNFGEYLRGDLGGIKYYNIIDKSGKLYSAIHEQYLDFVEKNRDYYFIKAYKGSEKLPDTFNSTSVCKSTYHIISEELGLDLKVDKFKSFVKNRTIAEKLFYSYIDSLMFELIEKQINNYDGDFI